MTLTPKRIRYIDTAKGLCIFLVVLFHAQGLYGLRFWWDPIAVWLRMPLYYFLSGYFFKTYGSFHRFLLRKTDRLLIPFVFFYLTTSFLLPNFAYYCLGVTINTGHGWPLLWAFVWPEQFPNVPIWFLWSLFLANLLFFGLVSLTRKYTSALLPLWLITLIIGVVGWQMKTYDINLPAFIDTTFYYFPFFVFGFCCKEKDWLPSEKRPVTVPVVSYFGRYSIMILVSHNFVVQGLGKMVGHIAGISDNWRLVIVMLLTVPVYYLLIPLMRRLLPHVTAQKNVLS